MKTYYITNKDGLPKSQWEEINCDYMAFNGDVALFYDGNHQLIIAYKLADGEGVVFSHET